MEISKQKTRQNKTKIIGPKNRFKIYLFVIREKGSNERVTLETSKPIKIVEVPFIAFHFTVIAGNSLVVHAVKCCHLELSIIVREFQNELKWVILV